MISLLEVKEQSRGNWGNILVKHAPVLKEIIDRGKKHGPCPLCGGKDRARCHNDFDETGGILCNQCGGGADGIAVLEWANDWTFTNILQILSGKSLKPTKREPQPITPAFCPTMRPDKLSWLTEERKISEEVVEVNRIGFQDNLYTFPYFKNSKLINIQSRNKNKTDFRLVKGCELPIYGYDFIDNEETIWTEGQLDMMSVQTAGFENVVSSPNGANSYGFFEPMIERFSEVKQFILWTDNDESGKAHELEIARRLGFDRCKRVIPVEGCKDANEVLQKHGIEAVRDAVLNAVDFPVEGVVLADDLDLIGHYEFGTYEGVSTGFDSIDRLLKFDSGMGELIICHGIPSSGKSEVADAIMVNTNLGPKEWKWGVFSPENFPLEYHGEKLAEKFIGKPFRGKNKMSVEDVAIAQSWMNDNIFFVMPEEEEITIDSTLAVMRSLVERKAIRGCVIDPINEYAFPAGGGLTETQWLNNQLTKLRRFARNHNLTIILVCHPTKLTKQDAGKYEGGFAPPSAYQIAGSASFRSKADAIFCVHRPKYGQLDEDGTVELHVQKVKKKYLGKVGMGEIYYQFYTGSYGDKPDPEYPFNTQGFVA